MVDHSLAQWQQCSGRSRQAALESSGATIARGRGSGTAQGGHAVSAEVSEQRATHQGVATAATDLRNEGNLPSFEGATTWLNSSPLTPAGLRGRVVLGQFWTYTCINWLRTHPYVRAWAKRYRDQGLLVVGVHTPEFAFEHDVGNVERQARAMGVEWPIAVDNDYEVWRAFANHYWPALYFVDARGGIRHHRFGEGDYERSEMVI